MGDALVAVQAKPGSKAVGVSWNGTRLILRVRERAHEGKANEACRKALAAAFNVAPARVVLLRGQRSKEKLFAISGLTSAELDQKLERLLA